jgi:hypothetical protein
MGRGGGVGGRSGGATRRRTIAAVVRAREGATARPLRAAPPASPLPPSLTRPQQGRQAAPAHDHGHRWRPRGTRRAQGAARDGARGRGAHRARGAGRVVAAAHGKEKKEGAACVRWPERRPAAGARGAREWCARAFPHTPHSSPRPPTPPAPGRGPPSPAETAPREPAAPERAASAAATTRPPPAARAPRPPWRAPMCVGGGFAILRGRRRARPPLARPVPARQPPAARAPTPNSPPPPAVDPAPGPRADRGVDFRCRWVVWKGREGRRGRGNARATEGSLAAGTRGRGRAHAPPPIPPPGVTAQSTKLVAEPTVGERGGGGRRGRALAAPA